jgi:hypothetical protein
MNTFNKIRTTLFHSDYEYIFRFARFTAYIGIPAYIIFFFAHNNGNWYWFISVVWAAFVYGMLNGKLIYAVFLYPTGFFAGILTYMLQSSSELNSGRIVGALSIVSGIVKAHNGEISVDSVPEEGAKFTIKLPLSEYVRT